MNRTSLSSNYSSDEDASRASITAKARSARLARSRELTGRGRSNNAKIDDENASIDTSSGTSLARDARRSRYGIGLNDISNNVTANKSKVIDAPIGSRGRTLNVPTGSKTTSESVAAQNRSLSVSSSRSSRNGLSNNNYDSDEDSRKSSTVRAREVRMNRNLNVNNSEAVNEPIQSRGRSQTRAQMPDKFQEPGALGYRNDRSLSVSSSISRTSKRQFITRLEHPNDDDDDISTISMGSIFRNGAGKPRRAQSRSRYGSAFPSAPMPVANKTTDPTPPPPPPVDKTSRNIPASSRSRAASPLYDIGDTSPDEIMNPTYSVDKNNSDSEPEPEPSTEEPKTLSRQHKSAMGIDFDQLAEDVHTKIDSPEVSPSQEHKETEYSYNAKPDLDDEIVSKMTPKTSDFATEQHESDVKTSSKVYGHMVSGFNGSNPEPIEINKDLDIEQDDDLSDEDILRPSSPIFERKESDQVSTEDTKYNSNIARYHGDSHNSSSLNSMVDEPKVDVDLSVKAESILKDLALVSTEGVDSSKKGEELYSMNNIIRSQKSEEPVVEKAEISTRRLSMLDDDDDYSSSRWNKFKEDQDILELESQKASENAIASAVEKAATLDVINSYSPEKEEDNMMILPIEEQMKRINIETDYDTFENRALDDEADLEKMSSSNRSRKGMVAGGISSGTQAVSNILRKVSGVGDRQQSRDEREILTSNGNSLPSSSHGRAVKSEKPWSKSLKLLSRQSGENQYSEVKRDEEEKPKSDHDRVREEAMRMLNLANAIDKPRSVRDRSRSRSNSQSRVDSLYSERRLSRKDTDDLSVNSESTDVTDNRVGHFSIDADSDEEANLNTKKEKSTKSFLSGLRKSKTHELVSTYDDNNEEEKEEIQSSRSSWSSRYNSGNSNLYSAKYMSNDDDYVNVVPLSARGMSRSSAYSHDVSSSYDSPMDYSGEASPNLTWNALRASASKDSNKKICYVILFSLFVIGCIVTVENVRKAKVNTIPPAGAQQNSEEVDMNDVKQNTLPPAAVGTYDPVSFYVMSDVPLNPSESVQLSDYLKDLSPEVDFAVHLGDIHDASRTLCSPSVYDHAYSILKKSPIPLLVLPGNEDFAACPEPFESLDEWSDRFVDIESEWEKTADISSNLERQERRKENFALFRNEVLFLGINLAGEYAREDEPEWNSIDEDNVIWTRDLIDRHYEEMRAVVIFGHTRPGPRQYEYYFQYLEKKLKAINVPALYIHGDALEDEPLTETYKPYEENGYHINALEVQRGGIAIPMQVEVHGISEEYGGAQFLIDRDGK